MAIDLEREDDVVAMGRDGVRNACADCEVKEMPTTRSCAAANAAESLRFVVHIIMCCADDAIGQCCGAGIDRRERNEKTGQFRFRRQLSRIKLAVPKLLVF
mmetsp:Transcript_45805/g.96125  ORF Transcript_45805/g.96125 Transcript_45805/m.96125 type:complete len:101 (-) Transcript_45805:54-356(-)